MQTHTAQKLRRISELKGEKICISYETKIFHVWSISHYLIYLFIYFSIRTNSKDKMIFSRLSVFKILLFLQQPLHTQLIICMTLQALWIDMTWSTNTCSLTSYKLRTRDYQDSKTLFPESSCQNCANSFILYWLIHAEGSTRRSF